MKYYLLLLFLFACSPSEPDIIKGCTLATACNYNPEVNEDDGSCEVMDCLGNCGGDAYTDPCGYCDADPDNDCSVECGVILEEFSIGEEEFQCGNGVTEEGYSCIDLYIILDIMHNNPHSLHSGMDLDGNKIITVSEYGEYFLWTWSGNRLTSLNMNYNEDVVLPTSCNFRLTTLPDNIGDLSGLITLSLNNNDLLSLPPSIVNLASLEQLFLESNQITSLPDNIENLINLKKMVISYNLIENLPNTIGGLVSLEQLWAQQNQLIDLPQSIGTLSQLQRLYLDDNFLQSLPESIGALDKLLFLTLNNNNLLFLPEELCSIYSGLVIFSVEQNFLCAADDPATENYEGSVPVCIDPLSIGSQTCVNCPPHFFFAGSPPECVYENDYNILQNFLDLNPESQLLPGLSGIPNSASGCINAEWWDEGRLVGITFMHKQLTSVIPDNFGDLDKLEKLRLTGNELIGEIPDNIINLSNLTILKLNSNNLSGSIPENIGLLSNLDTLHLSDNNFSAEIPPSITALDKLIYLDLTDNNLSGPIPENIGALNSLRILYLASNSLSEVIPESIGDLAQLVHLFLNYNQLSGQIPANICTLYSNNEFTLLKLAGNQLCPDSEGEYPVCIIPSNLGYQYIGECE